MPAPKPLRIPLPVKDAVEGFLRVSPPGVPPAPAVPKKGKRKGSKRK